MKRIINRIIGLILVLVLSTQGFSQSLSEFINTALSKNYGVRILKNEEKIASNNNTIGNSGQLPTVSLNGGISTASNNTHQELSDGSTRQGSNAQTSNMNLALLANWTAFDGFAVYANKDKLEYLELLGKQNSRFYMEQTIADIVMAYYQLVYEKQLLANYKSSLVISAYRVKIEERKKEVGSGNMMNYGQALVDYNTDSIRLMNQELTIASLEIEMNRILNNDLETKLSMEDASISFTQLFVKDSLFHQIGKYNSQLDQQRLRELISEAELRIEKANRYPKINLYLGYQFVQSQAEVSFIQLNRNLGPVVGLNVSFNLFNGGKTNTAIKNALLEKENTELTTEQVHANLDAQVLDLYKKYLSVTDQIVLARNNIETMQKVYEIAAKQLSKGEISGFEFRLAQLSLLDTQISLMQLQFALKMIEINLNRLSGSLMKVYL